MSESEVEIDSVPVLADGVIIRALSAVGVESRVAAAESPLRLRLVSNDSDSLSERIQAALEQVVLEHAPSMIPERVGPSRYLLHPPAA